MRERQKARMRRERNIRIAVMTAILLVVLLSIVCGVIAANSGKRQTSVKKKSNKTQTQGQIDKKSEKSQKDEKDKKEESKFTAVKYPEKSADYQDILSPDVLSPYVALLDVNNNEIIAGKSVDTRINPASMTKVMTLIVAVEHIQDMTQTFTMTNEIIDPLYLDQASRAGFEAGEAVTAKDLMYGLILPSGADGAVGLAMMVSGTEEEFVKLMNEKCVEMGLKNTHFTNTSGLHSDDHYTTPIEQAMIMDYAMQNETCAEILSTYQYTTAPTEKHPEGILLTSTMFSRMYGDEVPGAKILAGKTGYTQEAKQCLVSCAESKDKKYVVVTAGGDGRWDCIYDDFNLYGKYCEGAVEAANSPAGTEAENDGNTEGTSGSTGPENTSAVGN